MDCPRLRETIEASADRPRGLRQRPFAILVMFGGLLYTGLALLGLMVQIGFFDPSVLAFGALFIAVGFLVLWGKRWALAVGAGLSLFFFAFYITLIGEIITNPAAQGFWLVISVLPLLCLVAIFGILALLRWKKGLAQTPYLASPKSSGGLLTLAVVGFILGGLVIGGFSAGTISRLLGGGGQSADVVIVMGAAGKTTDAYSPGNYSATIGVPVSWYNGDTISHTVTSVGGFELDSGNMISGARFTHTFNTVGTYRYYCTLHTMMSGIVVVSP